MSRYRAELVCERSLAAVAEEIGIGPLLRLGKGEEHNGGRERASILSDAVEALIAALYLDGGMDAASEFIRSWLLSELGAVEPAAFTDFKTALQELVQRQPGRSIVYALKGESGPDHDKRFTVTVSVDGEEIGSGEGRTKKEAEQLAARSALRRLE